MFSPVRTEEMKLFFHSALVRNNTGHEPTVIYEMQTWE